MRKYQTADLLQYMLFEVVNWNLVSTCYLAETSVSINNSRRYKFYLFCNKWIRRCILQTYIRNIMIILKFIVFGLIVLVILLLTVTFSERFLIFVPLTNAQTGFFVSYSRWAKIKNRCQLLLVKKPSYNLSF